MSSGDLRRKRRRMTKWTWWWRHSTQDDERGESNRAVKLVQNLNDNSSFATVRVTIVGEDLGDDETPLDNEVEESFDGSRRLPARNTQHHIDTRQAAPIMLKRRRQAQTEDAIVDDNVDNMLKAGVIEEGNGAWGFPVVSVKKKDSETSGFRRTHCQSAKEIVSRARGTLIDGSISLVLVSFALELVVSAYVGISLVLKFEHMRFSLERT
ncbi:hypothetical protein PC112_g12039 [Phytophthora cactorum]|nr:hypothetical protein PC112_g12039 [Phytophthora cactorum]